MCENCIPTALPKPRLILRLGGLGNRKFGRGNGIDDDPRSIEAAVRTACTDVFAEIETILHDLHDSEMPAKKLHPRPDRPGYGKTHLLSLVFLKRDRWNRTALTGLPAGVFSCDKPLVSVLTGKELGGDAIIRETAVSRPKGKVEYSPSWVVAEPPGQVPDGLGVGEIPKSRNDLKEKVTPESPLTREEAGELADVVRRRAYGFRAQSEALRHHSDLLLAIWDPAAEGKAGGTSESVGAALRERIPVIALRITGPAAVGVRVMRSPEDLAKGDSPEAEWKEQLREVIGTALRFPEPHHAGHHEATSYHPRAAFASFLSGEPLRHIWTWRLWHSFDAMAKHRGAKHAARNARTRETELRESVAEARESGRLDTPEFRELERALQEAKEKAERLEAAIPGARDNAAKAWRKCFKFSLPAATPAPAAGVMAGTFTAHFRQAKDRAGSAGMSGVYGEAHRGGIIASYVLAAAAVVAALSGAILHVAHAPGWVLIATALIELAAIFLMYALSTCSSVEDWNEAYTDSRVLAEALRIMEVLGPMGIHTPLPRLPAYLRGDHSTRGPEQSWSVWYFRALVRMAPLRLIPPDGDRPADFRRTIVKWIEGQIRYHEENEAKQDKLHHDIEWLSKILFVIVGAMATFHLIELLCGAHHLATLGLLVCVTGPALIAAMHGFASQIEISQLRQRSSSMVKLLEDRKAQIEEMDLQSHPDQAETVWGLASESLAVASLMMDEAAAWSMIYKNTDIHAG